MPRLCLSGALVKLRKATIRFVRSVRLSVHPHGTTRLTLDGFSWNVIFVDFSKICLQNSSLIKIGQEFLLLYVQTYRYTYFITFRYFLLRMRNISDRYWRETQHTHFVFSNFFLGKSCRLLENVEQYGRAGQATDGNMAHAH